MRPRRAQRSCVLRPKTAELRPSGPREAHTHTGVYVACVHGSSRGHAPVANACCIGGVWRKSCFGHVWTAEWPGRREWLHQSYAQGVTHEILARELRRSKYCFLSPPLGLFLRILSKTHESGAPHVCTRADCTVFPVGSSPRLVDNPYTWHTQAKTQEPRPRGADLRAKT